MDTPWTRQERIGAYVIVLTATLSLLATVSVLAYAGFRSAKRWIRKSSPSGSSSAMDPLFLNLMLMDLLQALAALPNIEWMLDAGITVGPICTAQGALKHISGVGAATTTLAIAIHTFSMVVLHWDPPPHSSAMIIAAVWGFVALVVIIPNGVQVHHGLYGPVGFWCFLKTEYKWAQLFSHYLWVWLDGLLMIILYTIMYPVLRGWLAIDHGKIHWHVSQPLQHAMGADIRAKAKKLIYYPVLYVVCVFPNSLSRWRHFAGHPPSYEFTLFANALYILLGVLDVLLFLFLK